MAALFCCLTLPAWAQVAVTGKVKDASDNSPLPGVTVLIKGTTKGTITDLDGKFAISVPDADAVLQFSYIGYVNAQVSVGSQRTFEVSMQQDMKQLEEVVAIGYGVQKKSVVTGAIASVGTKEIASMPTLRVEQALQGRTPGVHVMAGSGQPGEGMRVRVRGAGTNGNADPLYIVDGMPVEGIDFLNPGDIESMEVLKDAASAAIYGSRAANGVVLITTKQGKKNSPMNLTYEGYYGVQNPWKKMSMLNASEYAMIMNEAAANSGASMPFANPASLGQGTDWQDAVFNKNAGIMNQQVTLTGGSDKSSFSASFSYFTQEGIVGGKDKSNFDRYTFRLNGNHQATKRLKIGHSMAYTHIDRRGVEGNGEWGSPLGNAINMDPLTKVYEDDPKVIATFPKYAVRDAAGRYYGISKYIGQEIVNPLARLEVTHGRTSVDKLVGNVFGEYEFIPGLKLRSNFGADIAYWGDRSYTPYFYLNAAQQNTAADRANKSLNQGLTWLWENVASYSKTIGGHDFTAMVGTTAQATKGESLSGSKSMLFNTDPEDAFLNEGQDQESMVAGGGAWHSTLLSYFGRVNYGYADKYLFTATLRSDGSSRFGANNRFAVFPSASLGWVLSEEPFLKNNPVLNFAKLRASWGQNGNQNIGDFRYTSVIVNPSGYSFGYDELYVAGGVPSSVSNPDLKWETSEQTDFGMDLGLWNDKVIVTADYYIKKTKDLLIDASIPGHVGNNPPTVNGGSVKNQGLELAIDYRDQKGDFKYTIGANMAYNKNEVTAINNTQGVILGAGFATYGNVSRAQVGLPIGYFYGYKTAGIFQNAAEVKSHVGPEGKLIQPEAVPGDVRFVDLNGDGKLDDKDRTVIGNPTPKVTFGINMTAAYKGFDVIAFFQGATGNDIFNGTRRWDLVSANMDSRFLDRWTGEGSTNELPRVASVDRNQNWTRISDLYIEDGSYIRLKNLQLGYTLPKDVVQKLGVTSARFYVAAQNLWTITGYNGFDPEVGARGSLDIGIDRGVYPQARTYMVGANISF